ncbi:MAG: lectin like domain-containing protein [Propionibacteriaceae bacterium]|jgi:C1A family cysteine protease|nr:lectin like domain-containing protein [Propionibacteriaceae bacterium]
MSLAKDAAALVVGVVVLLTSAGGLFTLLSDRNPTGAAPESVVKQADLPKKFDLRDEGWVTPPRYQEMFNTCTVFAAAASMESALLRKGLRSSPDLSEWHLYNAVYNEESMAEQTDPMMEGTTFMDVAQALSKWYGAADEVPFPYGEAPAELWIEAIKISSYRLEGAVFFQSPHDDESREDLKREIIARGALATTISGDSCRVGGDTCNTLGLGESRHAIAIIGWDDNYDRSKFTPASQNDGAWIIKNSDWNPDGSGGFRYLSYEDVSIEEAWAFDVDLAGDGFGKAYFYDTTEIMPYSSAYGSVENGEKARITLANQFEADDDTVTILDSVSFVTGDPHLSYEVDIYLTEDSDDGELMLTERVPVGSNGAMSISGELSHPGLHVIDLHGNPSIPPDHRFAVVITLTSQDDGRAIDIYREHKKSSEDNFKINSGESFIYDDDWEDIANYNSDYWGNLPIKVYTS